MYSSATRIDVGSADADGDGPRGAAPGGAGILPACGHSARPTQANGPDVGTTQDGGQDVGTAQVGGQDVHTPHSGEIAIDVRNVSKSYRIYSKPIDRLRQAFAWGRKQYYHEFWALRDINISVPRGGALGILGRNGSGKSTLLQIIAGTLAPTAGEVAIRGRIAALLELGSGFNPEFTGRENVYMNGAILGLSRREIDERFDAIAGFADIGEFLEQPVKTYSSGMMVRLAFAVQVQVDPDVLIIDEALAVGDMLFQKRCYERIEQLRLRGVTLVFVSHDQESIRTLTDQAVLLHEGRMLAQGTPGEALLAYRKLLHEEEKRYFAHHLQALATRRADAIRAPASECEAAPALEHPPARVPVELDGGLESTGPNEALQAPPASAIESRSPTESRSSVLAFGDLDAEIQAVQITDGDGRECSVFYPGDELRIRVSVKVHRPTNQLNVALRLRNKQGLKVYSWGTLNQDQQIWAGRQSGTPLWECGFAAGQTLLVEFSCPCALGVNLYEVQAGVSHEGDRHYGAQRILHWLDEAAFFQVLMRNQDYFFGGAFDMRMHARVT